ncbi:uncharacterized protein PFL1_04985 [Pseudozyma flocculosa PF-1]|uniref:Amino acid permease/ SLC12A domain-containing protein n=2 Tax=Pseudozyma flocculosa TaxID=84751 RepID=A0A061H3P1_9BASI|nr:uncharacterized protein PFL1_04985 [Pseudozyma flocculosa PF-1]EPQ27447.1 hypothetical protein PFL1_04985 [Pseudozyma flocculosa PF-1]SPO36124.1 probable DIP5 - Glutamate and aspartate permease - able to mediate transport of other amino acids [Pseudozyma flocculosa]
MASPVRHDSSPSQAFPDEKSAVGSDNKDSGFDNQHAATQYQGQVAEQNGLKRDLKGRQISMIAIGGALGTGLVIGTGAGLKNAGPGSLFIGFCVMGAMCAAVMSALGEMSTFMPHPRGFAGHATRFVSPEFGFATGVNYLLKYWVITANQVNAFALIVSYWRPDLSGGIFIAILWVFIVVLNTTGVKYFGEFEFWLSLFKIIVMVGLLLLLLIIDLGGSPTGDRIGFRNWQDGKAFSPYPGFGDTSLARFLGFWSVMVTALFAYTGSELVAVTVGEASNPRKTVPAAIKKTFLRIIVFYIGGVLLIGMVVDSKTPLLLTATKKSTSAAASPFVVAINIAQIKVLPDIINAALLLFTVSAANSDLYIAARTLYGLALDGQAPRIFRRVDKRGIPYMALGLSSLFPALAFINLSSGGPKTFSYLVNTVTILGGTAWLTILTTHIFFMRAMKAQGRSRDSLPWQAPLQPYSTYVATFFVSLVLITKGWASFTHGFKVNDFITNYIGIPVFFILIVGWKLWHKTKVWKPEEVDLVSGAKEFDEADEQFWKQDEEKRAAMFKEASFKQKVGMYLKEW